MSETIAALSTALGRGGIAVIRISGDSAFEIAGKVFFARNGKAPDRQLPNKMIRGNIVKDGNVIDDGMAVFFKAPHSFTGEDTVELNIHGGILLSRLTLEALFENGAVPAQKGEFTQRAFLSGKIGLSQAEAIIDLIDAKSEKMAVLSARQANGNLSAKVGEIYDGILNIVGSTYAYIDYPDEDMTDVTVSEMKSSLEDIVSKLDKLRNSYKTGKAVCEGIDTVIAGKPNTGKSSLLNLLLGTQRAIVTDIAGTTRDTVEETATVGNVVLRLCDTAGIRHTENQVEMIGVERALQKLNSAELVLAVFDGTQPLDGFDTDFISLLKKLDRKRIVVLINKCDGQIVLEKSLFNDISDNILEISAKTSQNLSNFVELIERMFIDGDIEQDTDAIVTNARQFSSVVQTKAHVLAALDALRNGFTQDVAALELEAALSELGDLDGRKVTEQVVHNIFSRFCVGK